MNWRTGCVAVPSTAALLVLAWLAIPAMGSDLRVEVPDPGDSPGSGATVLSGRVGMDDQLPGGRTARDIIAEVNDNARRASSSAARQFSDRSDASASSAYAGLSDDVLIGARRWPDSTTSFNPAVATDGGGYLVVWEDSVGNASRVLAVRVAWDGTLLDGQYPLTIVGTVNVPTGRCPDVAFNGSDYLVVWRTVYPTLGTIRARAVSPDGTMGDEFAINPGTTNDQSNPAVTYGSSSWFVVWETRRPGQDANIRGARCLADGTVLDSPPIEICSAAYEQTLPDVGQDQYNFVVVWQDDRLTPGLQTDIYGARVSIWGTVLDPAGIQISVAIGNQLNPAVEGMGGRSLVAWEDLRSGTYKDIYGARLDEDGTVLDPSGILISGASDDQYGPSVAIDWPSDWYVVWNDRRAPDRHLQVFGSRVDYYGVVLDPAGQLLASYRPGSAVAANNPGNCLLVGHNGTAGYQMIYGTRFSTGGTMLDPFILLSGEYDFQGSPAIASDGVSFLTVWDEFVHLGSNYSYDIHGAIVDPDGEIRDPLPIQISSNPSDQWWPDAAFDGTNYLVVWWDRRDSSATGSNIYGTRISADGEVLDPAGIPICTAVGDQEFPRVVFTGERYLVVWEDHRHDPDINVHGIRVNRNGTVYGDVIPIAESASVEQRPDLAFDGTNSLVVYAGEYDDVSGALVSQAGSVLNQALISSSQLAGPGPAVTFGGRYFFVAWSDSRNHYGGDIYGARVYQDLGIRDPNGIRISTTEADGHNDFPAVAFDGNEYFVTWTATHGTNLHGLVYGTQVSAGGVVLLPDGVQISTATPENWESAACANSSGLILAAYASFDHPPALGPVELPTIWGNFWDEVASGVPGDVTAAEVSLLGGSPNPFVGTTTLRFHLPEARDVSVTIYDTEGRLVRTLCGGVLEPGLGEVTWDGRDAHGRAVAPGIYSCRMEAGDYAATAKIVRIR